MPEKLLNNPEPLELNRPDLAEGMLTGGQKICLLLGNVLPLGHVCLLAGVAWVLPNWTSRTVWLIGGLYLLPPLVGRFFYQSLRHKTGKIPMGSSTFFQWWFLFQCQVLFCRFPFLEECLRMVPGVYSMWLRLWGASIGRLTYWSAGTLILDRSFLQVGDDVIFGAGVRINAHVLTRDSGTLELWLEKIRIGSSAEVGGYSLLTCGTEIAAGDSTRAFTISPPFSKWKNGKRVRGAEEVEP